MPNTTPTIKPTTIAANQWAEDSADMRPNETKLTGPRPLVLASEKPRIGGSGLAHS
jgi:hypothetical protein